MDQQPPLSGQPSGPDDMTIPMPAQYTPQPSAGQYGPYYPPPIPAQSRYRAPQITPQPARMPKHEAVAITRKLKTGLIAGSVMSFGVLVALVASHVTGATARQSSNGNASNSATNQPTYSHSDDSNGGFFDDGPSNSNTGGFGTSPSAPSQNPVGSTGVS